MSEVVYRFSSLHDYDLPDISKFPYPYRFELCYWPEEFDIHNNHQRIEIDEKLENYMKNKFATIEFSIIQPRYFKFNDVADEAFFRMWSNQRTVQIEI